MRRAHSLLRLLRFTVSSGVYRNQVVVGRKFFRQQRPTHAAVGDAVRQHQRRLVPAGSVIVEPDAVGQYIALLPVHHHSSVVVGSINHQPCRIVLRPDEIRFHKEVLGSLFPHWAGYRSASQICAVGRHVGRCQNHQQRSDPAADDREYRPKPVGDDARLQTAQFIRRANKNAADS